MSDFIVSARKYRPATFDTVVGQQSITDTLKNAIKNNHVAQAFLFCGPRGVGKTTCARILAKTLNCFNVTENIEACNQCESCKSFNEGHSLNIYELDAASNNSVDDIRALIDQVRIPPQLGSHKVYIIDEVHMLSSQAFNAFLKTLEEPPKHAIFILATTEKHKILPTILSRCQIFDFNRIQVKDIASHLQYIAEKEGVNADPDALHIIAQKADGALRDSLSIFDRMVSFSGDKLSYQDVIQNLNILDYDYYFQVTDHLLSSNTSQLLLLFNEILENGFDGHNFIIGLAEHLRNLMVAKDTVTLKLLEVGDNIKQRYVEQSKASDLLFLSFALQEISGCDLNYKSSKNQRLLVEITLLKLASYFQRDQFSEKKNKTPLASPSNPTSFKSKKAENQAESKVVASAAPVSKPVETAIDVKENVVNEPASTPIPKIPLSEDDRRGRIAGKSMSIKALKSMKQDESKQAELETDSDLLNGDKSSDYVNLEKLHGFWKSYAEEIRVQGKNSYYATLKDYLPEYQGENLVLKLANEVQKAEYDKEVYGLITYLKGKLGVSNLRIEVEVDKSNVSAVKIIYPMDIYKAMAEKNTAIEKLRTTFDLSLD
jgi:DNA polymerase III subunit gamma/tau